MQKFGYHGQILHVDLSLKTFRTEVMDDDWYRTYMGGGLLGAYFLLRDTEKATKALDEANLLVFASSCVAGYDVPGLSVFSVVSRSPISGGIAEAPCEGNFSHYLKRSGNDAIIFHGKSEMPVSLIIDDCVPRLVDAKWVWGKSPAECAKLYAKAYDADKEGIVAIGQAGENMVSYASVVSGSGNQAARMGVGAVMGSKNLKALVIRGGTKPPLAFPEKLEEIARDCYASISQNEAPVWKRLASEAANDADKGEITLEKVHSTYRGECQCPCCSGDCVTRMGDWEEPLEASSLNQWITGPLLNLWNFDLYLRANVLCNCYGLDPVSTARILKFFDYCVKNDLIGKEQGEIDYTGRSSILPLIALIAERIGIGGVLAQGIKRAAGLLDIRPPDELDADESFMRRVPDMRCPEDEKRQLKDFVCETHELHTLWGALGALDVCAFACHIMKAGPERIGELVGAVTGWDVSGREIMDLGERHNLMLRAYAAREDCAQTPPARLSDRAYGAGEYEKARALYFNLAGCDNNGTPREEALKDCSLGWLSGLL